MTSSSSSSTSVTVVASAKAGTISSLTPVVPSLFSHFVNLKLNQENVLLWKTQLVPYLRSQGLLGYVDGTATAPTPRLTKIKEGEACNVPNPAYTAWFQQGQLVLSVILSSLTKEILAHMLFMTTSA